MHKDPYFLTFFRQLVVAMRYKKNSVTRTMSFKIQNKKKAMLLVFLKNKLLCSLMTNQQILRLSFWLDLGQNDNSYFCWFYVYYPEPTAAVAGKFS